MIPTYQPYTGERARRYEQERIRTAQWQREHAAVALLLSRTEGTVLDIPVGTGRFGEVCKELKRQLLGMDISEEMMAQARAKGIRCEYGSAFDIGLPAKAVDTIVCLRFLNWCEPYEVEIALREFRRVARTDVILNLPLNGGVSFAPDGWKVAAKKQIVGNHWILRVLV